MSAQHGAGLGASHARQPASQEEIAASPLWHLADYDLTSQRFLLMRIEEDLYREASFLDQRMGIYQCPTIAYELKHLASMFPRLGDERGPLRFIFHVGHCGSTLLSRALATSERVLPFREPMSLRTLSADQRELDTPMSFMARPEWEWLLTTILDSLGRRFRAEQVNVIKATSTGNNLIEPILAERGSHRALMIYVPLETYLATMLGKHKEGGDLWGQARTRMRDWMDIEGGPEFALHDLRAPQFAVLSWITSMNYMLAARESFGDRVAMLNFEQLIADPEQHLTRTAKLFGIEQEGAEIVQRFPEISSSYSKRPDKRYTPETRAQLLRLARDEHAEDIRSGLDWAASLMDRTPGLKDCGEFMS